LQARHEDFRAAGAAIAAVSSSSVAEHKKLAQRIEAAFPILSDLEGKTIRDHGLLHPGALPGSEQPIARPAVLLIDPQGVVKKRFLTENWRVRERAEHLLAELRE